MSNKDASEEEIDIVYTWVNGGDPLFLSERKKFSGQPDVCDAREASCDKHFRDNGELLFSLRSIEEFAPWVRKIHIVTNGQVPAWLNMDCKRISLVTHRQLFRNPDHLPVFNSNAIELQLHKIPGLSRRFLYLNDDLFLCRPIKRSDFINGRGGQYIYFDHIDLHTDCLHGRVHDRAYAYTQMIARQLGIAGMERRLPAHCPQLFDRELLFRLEELFPDAFIETAAHRFRHPQDIVLRILYFIYILETSQRDGGHEPKMLTNYSDEYMFLMLNGNVLSAVRSLTAACRLRPRFLCINDDIEQPENGGLTSLACKWCLKILFPRASGFEMKNNGRDRYGIGAVKEVS